MSLNAEPVCMCDHELDQHDEDLACMEPECPCFSYEADEPWNENGEESTDG